MLKGLKSLLAGIVAGVGLGILFAPKKGSELRKNLKEEEKKGGCGLDTLKGAAVDMGKDMKGAYGELEQTEKFKKAKSEVKKHAKEAKKKAKEFYKENVPAHTRKQVKHGIDKAKETMENIADKFSKEEKDK